MCRGQTLCSTPATDPMRLSVPGLPGVYYDTDAESTAIAIAVSAAGRRAPKPKGYALQVLPHLWSFDVDLREVPSDHPLQYLHPEGARSMGELTRRRGLGEIGREVETALQFAVAVNDEVESAAERFVGRAGADEDAIVIEVEDGEVQVGGEPVGEEGEYDLDEFEDDGSSDRETIDVEDRSASEEDEIEPDEDAPEPDEFDPSSDEFDPAFDPGHDDFEGER